ncbi:MAG: arylsulfatase [Planctomycetota bacterium]
MFEPIIARESRSHSSTSSAMSQVEPTRESRPSRLHQECPGDREVSGVTRWLVLLLAIAAANDYSRNASCAADGGKTKNGRPNIILIMTDDQGYGDVGFHGNPVLKTPSLDRLAREGAVLRNFYVCPVCAPTRASLMTGRYHPRTGVLDTYLGRAMMYAEEVTLADILSAAGYRTGIFGKWHLGDCYPMRPMDQGFHESLVHRGGGLAQPSDPPDGPPAGQEYFNPVLEKNGSLVPTTGYCTDVFTNAAIEFIDSMGEQPFFLYLAFNAPHTPLQVPDSFLDRFREVSLTPDRYPAVGHPWGTPDARAREATARVYAMVENIDQNIHRLLAELERKGMSENTLILFVTDNGPQQPRYNAGMLARKGSVHEGGIRVPCFVRWPARVRPGLALDNVSAHIDVLPTLLAAAGVPVPHGVKLDGRSFLPLLEEKQVSWPDRVLFFQWHRGDVMERYRSFAARSTRYKLVQPLGTGEKSNPSDAPLLLFDMKDDPLETKNIAKENPEIVETLRQAYDRWFAEMEAAHHFEKPRIVVGSNHQNPVSLTRQDWRGAKASWEPGGLGHWEIFVEEPAVYDILVRMPKLREDASIVIAIDGMKVKANLRAEATTFQAEMELPRGPANLTVSFADSRGGFGPHQVDVKRRTHR